MKPLRSLSPILSGTVMLPNLVPPSTRRGVTTSSTSTEEKPFLSLTYSSHFVRHSGNKNLFGAGKYKLTKEEEVEQDRRLAEEEQEGLGARNSGDSYYYLPMRYKIALRATALEKEKQRILFVLEQQPQYTIDKKGGSVLGLPTRPDRVLDTILQHRQSQGTTRPSELCSPPTDAELFPYAHWKGTAAGLLRPFYAPSNSTTAAEGETATNGSSSGAVATTTHDVDYLRRIKKLYALNYYSRVHLTPKKHILSALYTVMWNVAIASWNAVGSMVCFTTRGWKPIAEAGEESIQGGGLVGAVKGFCDGLGYAVYFLYVGCVVSPVIHLPLGFFNTMNCFVNFFTSDRFFDSLSGRYQKTSVMDHFYFRRELQLRKRLIRAIGHQEFIRKRMKSEKTWEERMTSMGFSVEDMKEKAKEKMTGKKATAEEKKCKRETKNPYQVLQVSQNATMQQIKKQYKKLAMLYHPDVTGNLSSQEQQESKRKFQEVSSAYQVLSNPEKRKAYNTGGARGLDQYESQHGTFLSRTPEEIIQSIFGGEGFKLLFLGELYRSHFALRMEAQVNVSIAELEELQSIRTRQLAVELATLLDVHAKRPTTPYVPRTAEPPKERVVHRVQMGGLHDPLSSKRSPLQQRRKKGGSGGAPLSPELSQDIMTELGEPSRKGPTKAEAHSPFVLVPGSNEYNCFSRDFEDRVDKLLDYLMKASFGQELLYELGETYVVNAQRFLHIRPYYSTKVQVLRKLGAGFDRIWNAMTLKVFREKDKDGNALEAASLTRRLVTEFITMEFDNVIADLNVVLRNVLQIVCRDCTEKDPAVLTKRHYALWYLGEQMMKKGKKWNGDIDDTEMIAYLQQTVTSPASTSRPPEF